MLIFFEKVTLTLRNTITTTTTTTTTTLTYGLSDVAR